MLARNAIPRAAMLMPLGFLHSSMGRGRTPNRLIALVHVRAAFLALGAACLRIKLLVK
jgi:hypothetical protein